MNRKGRNLPRGRGAVCTYVHGHVSVFVCCTSSIPSTSRATKANGLQKFSGWPMWSQAGGLEGGIGGIRRVCICPRDSGMCVCVAFFFCVRGQGRGVAGSLRSRPILLCLRHSSSPGPRLSAFLSVLESPVNSCVCRGDRLAIKSSQS